MKFRDVSGADGIGPRPQVRPPAWMRLVPRRLMSRFLGGVGAAPVPRVVLRVVLNAYCKAYSVNMEESRRALSEFSTFREFFSRALREGAREVCDRPGTLVSPCDGRVAQSGAIVDNTLIQAKGLTYTTHALLRCPEYAARFQAGSYVVIYLAPGDYHRFHWPLDGTLHTAWHIPGDLWPVNPSAVATVAGLFAVNERVVLDLGAQNEARVAMVPVGALNVGSILIQDVALRTNTGGPACPRVVYPTPTSRGAYTRRRGDLMGWFGFGSSIVLLTETRHPALERLAPGAVLRMGTAFGET